MEKETSAALSYARGGDMIIGLHIATRGGDPPAIDDVIARIPSTFLAGVIIVLRR